MTAAESQLAADRANRQAARAVFDTRLAQVKADLEARSVGGRIADKALDETRTALDEAAAIARESKGVIGGTLALLALWLFRRPIIDALASIFGPDQNEEGHEDDGNR